MHTSKPIFDCVEKCEPIKPANQHPRTIPCPANRNSLRPLHGHVRPQKGHMKNDNEIKSHQQRLRERQVELDAREARLLAMEADLDRVEELRRSEEDEGTELAQPNRSQASSTLSEIVQFPWV